MRHLLIIAAAALAIPSVASASTDVACWNRDVERLDYYTAPLEGGDNQFFTAVTDLSDNTNVTLLYPASKSMGEFTQRLYKIRTTLGGANPTGCSNAYFNNLEYFMPTTVIPPAGAPSLQGKYSKSNIYPDPGPKYAVGNKPEGQSDGLKTLVNGLTPAGFNTTGPAAYRYLNWPINGVGGQAETTADACLKATSNDLTKALQCFNCVSDKGYWLNPYVADNDVSDKAAVFSTNFLRFHPTKWTLLSLAYKRLVLGPLLSQLREGVIGMNGTKGGKEIQKMLPQSCNGQGRPMEQKLSAIDDLSYQSDAKPIAEMLFNAAWYMVGQPSPWLFSVSGTYPTSGFSGKSEPCSSCGGDFIVLFSDGRGDSANPRCVKDASGNLPAFCTAEAKCDDVGMGREDDGNDYLLPATGSSKGPLDSAQWPAGTCKKDHADDVARWMAKSKLSDAYPETRLRTYVVGIGDPNNTFGEMTILDEIAKAGEGNFIAADTFVALERAIENVLLEIIERATSFSSSTVTSLQTRGFTSAIIPRFMPQAGAQWGGTLSRFALYNEFAAGCTSADHDAVNERNPNGDDSCNDFYLRDADGAFVGENQKGEFVVLDNTKAWSDTTGWPAKGTADEPIEANPYWEASAKLTERMDGIIAGTRSDARKIYTVAPNSSGGYDSALVPFTPDNAATVAPLLKLGGVNGESCTLLASLTRTTYATEEDCAKDVIKFMHGYDVLRQNPYNRTIPQPSVYKSRPNILGDIFHSTPVLVTPPSPTFLCDLGIANQCVASLYDPTLTPGGKAAYDDYFEAKKTRTQFILVGANDGMLHAFNAGDYQTGTGFDEGTGEELWAFIPPDMLPKLIRYVLGDKHELFVDGTAMVRDVWVDGSGSTAANNEKEADEFHTLAVFGEREGGRHYTALDVTNPEAPTFRWSWPPPGTTESLDTGGSWADLGPAAPPIGPIAEAAEDGPLQVEGQKARERYIVALGGGYDPALTRGRSINMLDVWNGQPVYRFARRDATDAEDPRSNLWPVAAPVSLMDTNSDGLFDTAAVGDVMGQVWAINMKQPGSRSGGGLPYDNWLGARAFEQFKGEALGKRSPFFQRAAAALLDTGEVRLFLGSGNRAQIKDPKGGTCGPANVNACIQKECSISVTTTQYRVGAAPQSGSSGQYARTSWSINAGASSATIDAYYDSVTDGNSCSDPISAELSYSISCGTASLLPDPTTVVAYCDWGATTPNIECVPPSAPRPMGLKVDRTYTVEKSRFYAFRLFDLGTRARFDTADAAKEYDKAALTDELLVNADVTTTGAAGDGWYVIHEHSPDERTASSGLLLGGCMIWNTVQANSSTSATCGTVPPDSAYSYQADAITGGVACGNEGASSYVAKTRSVKRDTYVSPQQPSPVISVNSATGEIAYSSLSLDPGGPPNSVTIGSGDLLGPIHWLEVSRPEHACRHDGNCN